MSKCCSQSPGFKCMAASNTHTKCLPNQTFCLWIVFGNSRSAIAWTDCQERFIVEVSEKLFLRFKLPLSHTLVWKTPPSMVPDQSNQIFRHDCFKFMRSGIHSKTQFDDQHPLVRIVVLFLLGILGWNCTQLHLLRERRRRGGFLPIPLSQSLSDSCNAMLAQRMLWEQWMPHQHHLLLRLKVQRKGVASCIIIA